MNKLTGMEKLARDARAIEVAKEKKSAWTDERLIECFAGGTTALSIARVAMKSEHFVIFHVPGHKYWSDRMNPSAYARSQHILIRQGAKWFGHGPRPVREWGGRVSRSVLRRALEEAERAGEKPE